MAKTLSPLLSASAHGKLARSLIYSKKKSGQLTRAMHYPKKEPSLKQWTRRHIVGLLTAHWQCMTDGERATWKTNAAASSLHLPGYQYFLKLAQADLETHHGLVLYLPLNESTGENFYCRACDMIAGTLKPDYPNHVPTRVPSFRKEYGNALHFYDDDVYGLINYMPKLGVTTQASFEAWIKLTDLAGAAGNIIVNWIGLAGQRCFNFRVQNDKLDLLYSPDGVETRAVSSDSSLTLEWTHVCVRLNLDNKLHFFINGVQDTAEADFASFNVYANDLTLGGYAGWNIFPGYIDEVRIYNRALSIEEIKKHCQLLRLGKKRQPLLRL